MPDEFTSAPDPVPLDPPYSLRGKKALVVGAGRPLGRAIAVALAEAGADVAVASQTQRPEDVVQVNSVANEIWSLNRGQIPLSVDADDAASVAAAVDQVRQQWGRIDILVNACDQVFAMPLTETTDGEIAAVLGANLLSVLTICREAGRLMRDQGAGRVVNVASVLGARGVANMSVYAAAHGGVIALTRALAQEWARDGITVNAIQLGFYEDQRGIGDDPDSAAALAKMLPSRSLVRSADVAATVLMLAADSGFLSGEVIALDGGATQRV